MTLHDEFKGWALEASSTPNFALPAWPMFGTITDMRPSMRAARADGKPGALATLHTVVGGGPRAPGAQMLLSEDILAGFLSGGCIEGDIAIHAGRTIADGQPRRLVYGEGSPWRDIQLLCGARIEVLVERLDPQDRAVSQLLVDEDARRPSLWITDGVSRRVETLSDSKAPPCQVRSDPFELRVPFEPTQRLIVIGADPTALAIAALGSQLNFETTLVRPKGPEAIPPLPGVAYRRDAPAAALFALALDPWTAVAVATHDLETDHEALLAALASKARYVGVLGAGRRVAERLHRLRAAGLEDAALTKLRAPIGLDLGGKAPWEIAVSVIGEIIAARGEGPNGQGRDVAGDTNAWPSSLLFAANASDAYRERRQPAYAVSPGDDHFQTELTAS